MHDPIIVLISSYREGELIQGAIRSVLPLHAPIIVYEGPTEAVPPIGVGHKTALGRMKDEVATFYRAEWKDEASKRNAMLAEARERMPERFWILTIDADEILLWPEYLPDWLNALRPGYPRSDQNVAPLKITVPGWDEETKNGPITYIQPSRLTHSSLIGKYEVGLVIVRTPDELKLDFSSYRSEVPPLFGEPHFHHRYYLRTGERGSVKRRGVAIEEKQVKEWVESGGELENPA